MNEIAGHFRDALQKQGIAVSQNQLMQFERYYKELVSWNEKLNLTAITDYEQVLFKHFYDSISIAFYMKLQHVSTLADIGSGAGFPGIPLKIMFPHLQVTIIDSLNKRIQFLSHLSTVLRLEQVHCWHGRAEDAGRLPQYRDRFDVVTARAVARLSVLCEFCLPLVKPEGAFVAMKSAHMEEEMKSALFSVHELKAKIVDAPCLELPLDYGRRQIVVMKKTALTPKKYPRKAGFPLKFPLEKV